MICDYQRCLPFLKREVQRVEEGTARLGYERVGRVSRVGWLGWLGERKELNSADSTWRTVELRLLLVTLSSLVVGKSL